MGIEGGLVYRERICAGVFCSLDETTGYMQMQIRIHFFSPWMIDLVLAYYVGHVGVKLDQITFSQNTQFSIVL